MKNDRWARAVIGGALVAAVSAAPARAWGPLEHKAVALVAQDRLSPQARRAVRDLLGDAGLDRIANCADGMLHASGAYDCGGVFSLPADASKTTAPWHFINIPIAEPTPSSSVMTYCPNGQDCVVEQIRRQAAVLRDPTSLLHQKRVALMFLVHFVGDAHQPLHCADDDDRGGNGKPVVFEGTAKNLHSLWDDMILAADWKQQSAMDPAPLVGELEADIRARGDVAQWTSGDFVAAAAIESFGIARDTIYPRYAQDHGQDLGAVYQGEMQPIAKRRIEMAGVRLAALLEQALVPQNPERPD